MTLDELQRLTDNQLIEKVAVEVMGWVKKEWHTIASYHFREWEGADGKGGAPYSWNPLTDWNHTMEVVAVLDGKGWGYSFNSIPWFEEGEDQIEPPTANFFHDHGRDDVHVGHEDLKRAICLAALLALSPS